MIKANQKIRKLIIMFSISGVLAAGMTACNSEDSSDFEENTSEEDENEEENNEEIADVSETEDEEDTSENRKEDSTEKEADFSYEDLENVQFWFGSGAGAWCTTLEVEADGSFSGVYHDSDMGDTGEGYPNGTCYISEFSGQFGKLKKVNEYTYSTRIRDIQLENEPDTEEIVDEIKYVYTKPYGLDNPKEILFYLKGAPVDELPEGYLSWVENNCDMGTELPFYGLYNEAAEEGFSGAEYLEDDEADGNEASIEDELKELEQQAKKLQDEIENQSLTQLECNEKSAELYELWDNKLNEIWGRLKDTLDEEAMEQLTEEERAWISEKESAIEEAGAEYEGGSMQSMVENFKGAELTRERVYELAEKLRQ